MHAKNNRLNKDFQIAHFLVGSCHTADAAYSLLCDLKENRELALGAVKASQLRTKAKIIKAERMLQSDDEVIRLEGEADLADLEANKVVNEKNVKAAEAELSFINKCIEQINPLRKYKHLSDPEAHEACQREEWKLELLNRAENYLITSGSIPAEHFTQMRFHPDFALEIMPKLKEIANVVASQEGATDLLLAEKKFSIPLLGAN